MVLPCSIACQTRKIAYKIKARAFLAFCWVSGIMLFTGMLTSTYYKNDLQGALHDLTSKSFLLTNQYIPHSSGLDGTYLNVLHAQSLQEVLNFFPKKALLCIEN